MAYRNTDITALHDRLEPHNVLNPPAAYWIVDSVGDDATGGMDFCFECGSAHVERLNLYAPGDRTYEFMWCDPCGGNDTIPRCDECGKTLAGWPTDYCASNELEYFEDEEPELTPENVHVVNMVMWNLQWSEDHAKVSAWLAVAEKLAAKIPEAGALLDGVAHRGMPR